MPQIQMDAYLTLVRQLPEIAKQMEIANKLKALELKLKFHGMVEPIPEWVSDIDKIMKEI